MPKKLTELSEVTTTSGSDILYIVDNSSGSPTSKRVTVNNFLASSGGWISSASMVYSSSDAPSYVVTMTGDQSGVYQAGQRIKLTLDGSNKYFIVTKVEASGSTALTLYGGTDYVLSASPINNPYYSLMKAPFGFPLDPVKWTAEIIDNTSASLANPVAGTWYNLGTTLSIPIGIWNVDYCSTVDLEDSSTTALYIKMTLSDTDSTQISNDYTIAAYVNSAIKFRAGLYKTKTLNLTTKTIYYLNVQSGTGTIDKITTVGTIGSNIIRAICAYL